MASRILGGHAAGGPFGKPLPEHTTAELDFILEMAARDDPERYIFTRGGVDPRRAEGQVRAAWHEVLSGAALAAHMERDGLAAAQRRLAAYRERSAPMGLRPGFSRGGKPIVNADG